MSFSVTLSLKTASPQFDLTQTAVDQQLVEVTQMLVQICFSKKMFLAVSA